MSIDILNVPTMTSLEIADFVLKEKTVANNDPVSVETYRRKLHGNILHDIRVMLVALYGEGGRLDFKATYSDKQGKEQPMFRLPKRECLILVAKYSLKVRAAIIDRWLELEDPAVTNLAPMDMLTQLQSQVELAVGERDAAVQAYSELKDGYNGLEDSCEAEQAINQEVEDELTYTKQQLENFQESEAELTQAVKQLQPSQYTDAIQKADMFIAEVNTHILEDAQMEISRGTHLCMVATKAIQVYRTSEYKAAPPGGDLRHLACIEIAVGAAIAHSIAVNFFTNDGIDLCEPGNPQYCKPEVIEFGLYYTAYALQNEHDKVEKLFNDFQVKTGLTKENVALLAVSMFSCLPLGYVMPEIPAGRIIVCQRGRVYWKVAIFARVDMD